MFVSQCDASLCDCASNFKMAKTHGAWQSRNFFGKLNLYEHKLCCQQRRWTLRGVPILIVLNGLEMTAGSYAVRAQHQRCECAMRVCAKRKMFNHVCEKRAGCRHHSFRVLTGGWRFDTAVALVRSAFAFFLLPFNKISCQPTNRTSIYLHDEWNTRATNRNHHCGREKKYCFKFQCDCFDVFGFSKEYLCAAARLRSPYNSW